MLIDSEPVQKFFKTPHHRWAMLAALLGVTVVGGAAGYAHNYLYASPSESHYDTTPNAAISSTGWGVRMATRGEIGSVGTPLGLDIPLDSAGIIYLPTLKGFVSSDIQVVPKYNPITHKWFPDLIIHTPNHRQIEQRVEGVNQPDPNTLLFSQGDIKIIAAVAIDRTDPKHQISFTELQELP